MASGVVRCPKVWREWEEEYGWGVQNWVQQYKKGNELIICVGALSQMMNCTGDYLYLKCVFACVRMWWVCVCMCGGSLNRSSVNRCASFLFLNLFHASNHNIFSLLLNRSSYYVISQGFFRFKSCKTPKYN